MTYTVVMKATQLLIRAQEFYDDIQISELRHAIEFAEEKHAGQKRMSGEAYITHPLQVADILIDWGMDIDTILAGVLHDTIEDTETTIETIESLFGRDVAFLVDGVTKVSKARSGMRDITSYLPTTKDNLSKLLIAVGQDVRVIIIKLADRLHNLQTLEYLSRDKQLKIARESLEVFASLADRLNMGRVRVQIEELSFSYLEPREYKLLRKLMKDRLGKSHRKLATVRHSIDQLLTKENINHTMDGRIKSVYSLYKKLKKVETIDNVYDLIALRIIVDDNDDCYRVLGIIHNLYQPMVNRIKDYIAVPKPNGYQSLHTTIITPQEQIVEFQIRTKQMHEYAEQGLAASFHYNEQKMTDAYRKNQIHAMPAHLEWITELQEVAAKLKAGEEVSMEHLKVDLFADRIFVYSPKGDIYDLPEGAFPLDYAYRIHSDIGKHAVGFRINNKMVAFDRPLQDGDIIQVITKRTIRPKIAWLELMRTSHAKEKLKGQLKKAR